MLYETHLTSAREALMAARRALTEEISGYPTPISGCDAQFTRLLSDRTRIGEALAALDTMPFIPTPRVMAPGARVESR